MSQKRYLGDGVYLRWDEARQDWVLTTENGYSVTNRIHLEPQVMNALVETVKAGLT